MKFLFQHIVNDVCDNQVILVENDVDQKIWRHKISLYWARHRISFDDCLVVFPIQLMRYMAIVYGCFWFILTLYVIRYSDGTLTSIYILCHSSTPTW